MKATERDLNPQKILACNSFWRLRKVILKQLTFLGRFFRDFWIFESQSEFWPYTEPPFRLQWAVRQDSVLEMSHSGYKCSCSQQGADSCELVSFSGLLNRSDQSVQKCTENMLIWGIVSRRGTSSLETNEILKVYKSVQLFSGGVRSLWMQKKCTKCTKVYRFICLFSGGVRALWK